MKVYESGIVYKKDIRGYDRRGLQSNFCYYIYYVRNKTVFFGKRKFKINQRSEGLSNYSEALKLNKAYEYALAETWIEAHKNDNDFDFIK